MKAENKPVELYRLAHLPSAESSLGGWLTGCQGPTAAHFPVADGGSQAPSPEQDLTV